MQVIVLDQSGLLARGFDGQRPLCRSSRGPMTYTITGRRAHVIQSRGALYASQAAEIVKEMLDEGFDVLSIIDGGNRPLTIDALLERADDEVRGDSPGEPAASSRDHH